MATVSLLHPTRGRTDEPIEAFEHRLSRMSWQHTVEYVLAVDEDDPIGRAAVDAILRKHYAKYHCLRLARAVILARPDQPFCHVRGINSAFKASTGEYLVHGDDDLRCPQNWDDVVVQRLGDPNKEAVLGVADPHWDGPYQGDGLLSSFICTRTYARKQGYIVYPAYDGMMCDVEWTQRAALEGVLIDAYDVVFSHHWKGNRGDAGKPGYWDATHQQHMRPEAGIIGKKVYEERLAQGFPPTSLPDGDWSCWVANARLSHKILELPIKVLARRNLLQRRFEQYRTCCFGRFNFHAGVYWWKNLTAILGDEMPVPYER